MAQYPAYYLYALNIHSGFTSGNAVVMTAIELAESNGDSAASKTDPDGTVRRGLYMLPNDVGNDITVSGRNALALFNSSGFAAWPSYANGSYSVKLPAATTGRVQFDQSVASATAPDGGPLTLPAGLTREKAVAAAIVGLMGIAGHIGTGISGAVEGAGSVLEESIPAAVRGLTSPLADIGAVLEAFHKFIQWFTSPQNLWRVLKAIIGMVMIFYGGMAIISNSSVVKGVKSGILKTTKVGAIAS